MLQIIFVNTLKINQHVIYQLFIVMILQQLAIHYKIKKIIVDNIKHKMVKCVVIVQELNVKLKHIIVIFLLV